MQQKRRLLLLLAANIVPVLIVIVIGEMFLRHRGDLTYQRSFPGQYEDEPGVSWVQRDPTLGWTVASDYLPGEINAQGFRSGLDFDQLKVKGDLSRIMILGDSFTFGAGLPLEEAYPSIMQSIYSDSGTDIEIFNLGVPGYGVDQMMLTYHEYAPVIKPDVVILAYIAEDVERVLEAYRIWEKLNKPSFTVEDGALVERQPVSGLRRFVSEQIGKSVFFSSAVFEWLMWTDAKEVMEALLVDMAADVDASGADFYVLRIATQDEFERLQQMRRNRLDVAGVLADTRATYIDSGRFITGHPHWDSHLYQPDGHLNAQGNKVLAQFLLQALQAQ